MKRTFLALALVPFASLPFASMAPAQAPTPPDRQSVALVAALRLENVILDAVRGRGGELNQCVARSMVFNLRPELARLVPKLLTRGEIDDAVLFFESATGKKLVDHNLVQLARQRGYPGSDRLPDPPPTADDRQFADKFLATSGGRKINDTGYLLNAPAVQTMVGQKAAAAADKCKAASPAAKPAAPAAKPAAAPVGPATPAKK